QRRLDELAATVREHHDAPRRLNTAARHVSAHDDARVIRPRRNSGADAELAAAKTAEIDTAPIAQVGFRERECGRAGRAHAGQRSREPIVLANAARAYRIELAFVTRVDAADVQSVTLVIRGERELGTLEEQQKVIDARLIGKEVTERHTVIVRTEDEIELALPLAALLQMNHVLVEVIARGGRFGRDQRM